MANKASFTAEEWNQVLESVMIAGIAVTASAPSGLFGLIKESLATGGALAEAKAAAGSHELIKAVVADYETSEGRTAARGSLTTELRGSKTTDIKDKAL